MATGNNMTKPHYIAIAAMTVDGKIAKSSTHLSTDWTSKEDKKFLKQVLDTCDAVILGRNTYETAKALLVKRKRNCIVFTRRHGAGAVKGEKLTFMKPTKRALEAFVKERKFRRLAVLGGSHVYSWCLRNGFMNELYLTIEPVIFGDGLSLFSETHPKKQLHLRTKKILNKKGTLLLHYDLR